MATLFISAGEGNKGISVIWSENQSHNFKLWNTGDTQWNILKIDPRVITNSIKIVIRSVYGRANNGFKEIRVTGCVVKEQEEDQDEDEDDDDDEEEEEE